MTAPIISTKQEDWTKPAAMTIPKGGFFKDKVEEGRYGPIFPKTPACYGFSILAKVIPGKEERFYEYARNIEQAVAAQPDCLAVLKLHYLRWVLFPIKGDTYFMYQGNRAHEAPSLASPRCKCVSARLIGDTEPGGMRHKLRGAVGRPLDRQHRNLHAAHRAHGASRDLHGFRHVSVPPWRHLYARDCL
jgi:hypothetical protein